MRLRLATAIAATAALLTSLALPASSTESAQSTDEADPELVAGELLVGFKPGSSASDRAKARASASSALVETVVPGDGQYARVERIRVRVGTEQRAIARLEKNPNVAYAEPNWVLTTAGSDDPYFMDGSLWGMYGDALTPSNKFGSQAAEAWSTGNTGTDTVYVGVIDEGVDVNHPDLAGNIWTNSFDVPDGTDNDGNGYVDDTHGWDFDRNDNSVFDGRSDDHGTHVAGTIGAVGGNGVGVAGVAWDVQIVTAKFLGRRGGTTANAVKAVDYITDLKTRHSLNIVATNNSWGGGGHSNALEDAIIRAGDADILFVAAAGNGDMFGRAIDNDQSPHYPSSYGLDNVVSVAAIDSVGAKASWSNYGATSVDLGAPGVGIWSTLPNGDYGSYSGTSMATPHVTGAVSLYAAVNPTASASAVKAAILGSAEPTDSMTGRTVTGGRLDVSGFVGSGGGGSGGGGSADPPNALPTAAFTWECTDLECTFTDGSSDTDGQVTIWEWTFDDAATSTDPNPSHAFTAPGTYDVTLIVTDDDGGTSFAAEPVTVTDPVGEPAPIVVTVEESSTGWNKVSVRWAGAAGSEVRILRDGETLTTTDNDGEHTDNTRTRGTNYSFSYEVCEVDMTRCSGLVVAAF